MTESPTSRSLKKLRDDGWEPDIVERWIGGGRVKVRKDFYGFADIIAVWVHDGCPETAAIQTTTAKNSASRRAKILAEPRAHLWLSAGNRIILHGWRKSPVKRGSKRKIWICNVQEITLEDIPDAQEEVQQEEVGSAGN